jgi:hypothetical protein
LAPVLPVDPQVLEDDFGRYFCVIANVLGESECSAYLVSIS